MGASKTVLTAQEFDNCPFEEDKRYELDEGELIATKPAYKHNRVSGRLLVELELYFRLNPYFAARVKEVWLIDPDVKEIEIWKGPSLPVLASGDILASTLLPGFALPLEELSPESPHGSLSI